MAQFKSDNYTIKSSVSGLKAFLSAPSNLKEILPGDRIENWKETEDSCSFKIKGLAEVFLKLEESSGNEVVYVSTSPKPFPFKLIIELGESGENGSINAYFDAEVNSFMGAMLKTPLVNFLNSLGDALTRRFSA